MHPRVNATYQKFAEKYEMKGPFLEIGVGNKDAAILSGSYFLGKPDRFATNLSEKEINQEEGEQIQFVRCNSNDMKGVFADGQFNTILSNAVIEHDKYFWRSLDELKRILAPGGILAIGAPAYVPRKQLKEDINNDKLAKATITLDMHSAPDYWRFSRMAFKEVICEGLELLEMTVVLRIPILVAVARKPLDGLLPPVPQEDRVKTLQEEKAAKKQQREARLQAREAEEAVDISSLTPEEQAARQAQKAKREARLQARDAKLQERAAKAAAGPAAAVSAVKRKPGKGEGKGKGKGKGKGGNKPQKAAALDENDDFDD